MKHFGFLKPNNDPEMVPVVACNKGPIPVRLTSILEAKRPDLLEHEDQREIILWPGKRTIVPHGYYMGEAMGKSGRQATVEYHVGDRAPELRGYNCTYQMRGIMSRLFKRIDDFFVKG